MITRLNTDRTRSHTFRADRRAFTLVELLIVIVVIAILSSMVIMALTTTMGSAKDVHTRATITKLHDLIMQKYESYSTRRVPSLPAPIPPAPPYTRATIARVRLDAIRDIMRMEMPDRFSDFTYTSGDKDSTNADIGGTINGSTRKSSLSGVAISVPSVCTQYRNRLLASGRNLQYESAECLYMIIAYGLQDQEALERFSESEIGDVDEDGLPEFIDAWGQPISFIRWPVLYPSELQMHGLGTSSAKYPKKPNLPTDPDFTVFKNYLEALGNSSHDPFDSLRLEKVYVPENPSATPPTPAQFPAFSVVPLIYSAGPDKIYDVDEITPANRPAGLANKPFALNAPGAIADTNSDGDSNGWLDNITNHDLLVP